MDRFFDSLRGREEPGDELDGEQELADDVASLAALIHRLEQQLDKGLYEAREEAAGHFSALDVSIGALEDRLEDRLGAVGTGLRSEPLPERGEHLARLRVQVQQLEDRLLRELPTLRDELDETVDKRVHSALTQLLGREQATRDRFEARITALRRDVDRGQRRLALLIATVLATGFLAYTC